MSRHQRSSILPDVSLYFSLLVALLICLCIAGGASRADVAGQAVVRGAAWSVLIVIILWGRHPKLRTAGPAIWFFVAVLASVLLQLIPLPPGVWELLPGRDLLLRAAVVSDQPQPWRPLSISPGSTANAAASLVVPFATLLLGTNLVERERSMIPGMLLCVVIASTLVGLMQFTGVGFDNPLINEDMNDMSGTFANRNHFALMLAIGCLLAPAWAFRDGRRAHWRAPVVLGTVMLFVLTILASGSRAGILIGSTALAIGLLLSWRGIRSELRHAPRWALPTLIATIIAMIAILVIVSIAADRAVSINRALTIEVGADIRHRSLPVVLSMVRDYFPAGSGYGSFDQTFRIHEPFDLLKLTFFNHAHDDFLEIIMNGGLPGLALLTAALGWWGFASIRAWRPGSASTNMLPKLGSAILFLIFVASLFDYPARTPIIMAVIAIAAIWLGDPSFTQSRGVSIGRDALPMSPKDTQAHV